MELIKTEFKLVSQSTVDMIVYMKPISEVKKEKTLLDKLTF